MKSEKRKISLVGTKSAQEIYYSVGEALSWWESSENIIKRLFEYICNGREQIACEVYSVAPRESRNRMLRSALEKYSYMINQDEKKDLIKSLKELDRLAQFRNEVAHGYCSDVSRSENEIKTMSGHYIIPTAIENNWGTSPFKFAHTAEDIRKFISDLRIERGKIMDIMHQIMMREQSSVANLPYETQIIINMCKNVVNGLIAKDQIKYNLDLPDEIKKMNLISNQEK